MPNQNNPDPNKNSPSPIFPQSDLPPLPPGFQGVTASVPAATTTANNLPPIISPLPKKKFGGGRIIATILGILLLVGGVAGGVLLTQQNQDVREKASGICQHCEQDECEAEDGCKWIPRPGTRNCGTDSVPKDTPNGSCRQDGEEEPTPPPTPTPTPTPPSAGVPVCQSATISKNTLTGPGDSLTITSTATTSDITGFSYGFYNQDNLYGPGNAKPIWFTNNTHYVVGSTTNPTSTNTITVNYSDINKPDLNWDSQNPNPTKIQVNAFFGNSAGWNHSDAKCVVQFNVAVATTPTTPPVVLSCAGLTSNVASPVVGQSITGTCRGTFPSSVTSPVARFRVSLNGSSLGTSGTIPLILSEASYTTVVPQAGSYVVECQICSDNTASNCTTWGQAN